MLVTGLQLQQEEESKTFLCCTAILDTMKHEMVAYDVKYNNPHRVPYMSKRKALTGTI
jgi:hypothetical protein